MQNINELSQSFITRLNDYLSWIQFRVVHLTPKIIKKKKPKRLPLGGMQGCRRGAVIFIKSPSELVEFLKSHVHLLF